MGPVQLPGGLRSRVQRTIASFVRPAVSWGGGEGVRSGQATGPPNNAMPLTRGGWRRVEAPSSAGSS